MWQLRLHEAWLWSKPLSQTGTCYEVIILQNITVTSMLGHYRFAYEKSIIISFVSQISGTLYTPHGYVIVGRKAWSLRASPASSGRTFPNGGLPAVALLSYSKPWRDTEWPVCAFILQEPQPLNTKENRRRTEEGTLVGRLSPLCDPEQLTNYWRAPFISNEKMHANRIFKWMQIHGYAHNDHLVYFILS